jgi:hypothetical protein
VMPTILREEKPKHEFEKTRIKPFFSSENQIKTRSVIFLH